MNRRQYRQFPLYLMESLLFIGASDHVKTMLLWLNGSCTSVQLAGKPHLSHCHETPSPRNQFNSEHTQKGPNDLLLYWKEINDKRTRGEFIKGLRIKNAKTKYYVIQDPWWMFSPYQTHLHTSLLGSEGLELQQLFDVVITCFIKTRPGWVFTCHMTFVPQVFVGKADSWEPAFHGTPIRVVRGRPWPTPQEDTPESGEEGGVVFVQEDQKSNN